ncbi:hypothetical protein GLOIN_2v1828570, partial [Rhizophagus irregularis DAOM 181602=DAOM 197198]
MAALKTARVQLNNLYGYGGWRSWFASRPMVGNVQGMLGYVYCTRRIYPGMVFNTTFKTDSYFSKTLRKYRFEHVFSRDFRAIKNKSNSRDGSRGAVFCLKSFHGSQERWEFTPCYRSKKIKYICQVFAFQDGRDRPCKITSATRRFYGFNRSQPSLLSRSCVDWIKKVLYLRFHGKTILFQLFTLWVYSQSKDIYKNSATDNKVSMKQRDPSSGILGQYSDNCVNQGTGSGTRTIHDFLSSKSGLHHKRGKIFFNTFSSSRLSRISDRFQVHDDKTTETQDQRFNTRMQKDKPKASNSDNSIHRRFNFRMGRVPGGLCNTWKMAKNGTASSHQHSRVKSDLVRSSSLQRFKGPTDYDTHRQYNMRCLHKSSGRNNFYFTVKDSGRAMDSLSGTECSLKSRTHPRNSEFNGGSSFSNEDRQIRLEVENQLVQDVQSNLGTTSYRPLCK